MKTARLEAFTDGVVAIIITITVLEMRVPHMGSFAALREVAPVLAAYVLSFVNVGIYWNNHHHMLHATDRVDGRVLWANMFMLFWLSLVPWVIRWADDTGFSALPVSAYGFVLAFAALGYIWTQAEIIRVNGRDSAVAKAVGDDGKGKLSIAGYTAGIAAAWFAPWLSGLIYVAVSLLWFIPDRRIERELESEVPA
jgi:uncharacterized membrane protein